jgi:Undecaprenyl-phosphate glucose phosphotransferase
MTQVSVVFSRGWMVLFFLVGLSAILLARCLFVRTVAGASQAAAIATKSVFLIGTGPQVEKFLRHYEPWQHGARIVGCRFLTSPPDGLAPDIRQELLARDLEAAVQSARHLEPDAFFVLTPWNATEVINKCTETLLALPVEFHLCPDEVLYTFTSAQLGRIGPITSLQLTRLPLSRFEILQKRVFDVVLSAIALVIFTVPLAIIALLIKLDSSGPVFFIQRRHGFNQDQFPIIKFRTMGTLDDGAVVPQATRGDPRVTRIGRWLRRWNIDEIPQLFNVLKGDMSLVGPRPHALSHNFEYERKISLYARRHNVKPGITGWAQIHGLRGETNTDEMMRKRVEYDLYYIDNWSFALDLGILVQTVISRSAYRNAY